MAKSEYDDEVFFREYAKMPRSMRGLDAAGEWPQFRELFPPLENKRVLDLGCGYGWHCRYAAERGASHVLGLDASVKMIEEARSRTPKNTPIEYRVCGIEDYDYPEEAWDVAVSNLALHYIADLDSVFARVFQTLAPHGVFLLNIEHPTFTAGVRQDFVRAADGQTLYWPVDDYFLPGERTTLFCGCEVKKQHHTLTQILMGLIRASFTLEAVVEAQPPNAWLKEPGMRDELRRPMMLLIRAKKR